MHLKPIYKETKVLTYTCCSIHYWKKSGKGTGHILDVPLNGYPNVLIVGTITLSPE